MSDLLQVRFGGFGGQGIVLMGAILGDAAVRDGRWAAGSNSYGSQARGSACRSEVILASAPVDFPHVLKADVLVALSQEAYERFLPEVHPEGAVIHDTSQVKPLPGAVQHHVSIPATATALSDLNSRQVANVILLGAAVALTGMVSRASLEAAVEEGVGARFRDLNRRALQKGFELGGEARQNAAGAGALKRFGRNRASS
jgi:2-oxoglutarate ferredoxin oxidoreductase subunit gamma